MYIFRTSGGVGAQRLSSSICFCKTEKQVGWTQHVVSNTPFHIVTILVAKPYLVVQIDLSPARL